MTPADITPDGCRHCSEPQTSHGRLFTDGTGWHSWTAPTSRQRLARRLARRRMRHHPGTDALINDLTKQEAPAVAPAEAIPNPNERTSLMSHTESRAQVIAGLRALADLAERVPDLLLPTLDIRHALPGHTDQAANAVLDQTEAALTAAGVDFTATRDDHDRRVLISVGGQFYEVFHVWDHVMAALDARTSYNANVQVETAGAVA